MRHHVLVRSSLALSITLFACGSDVVTGAGGAAASTGAAGGATTGSAPSATSTATGGNSTSTSTSTASGAGVGGMGASPDPNVDGPYAFTEIDASVVNPTNQHAIPIHCAYPTSGPSAGPYPVIVVAHGFQLPASQYSDYVKRLASFGYVALTADYPAGLFTPNNVENAKDLLAALDWTTTAPQLAGKADASNAGMTGHSLGGKLALLASTMDARVKAAITLDPVDSSMNCSAQDCPDVSALMPSLHIPTAFLGETTDAVGGFQACAPAADNYTTFYAGATSPSLEVTVNGANHMSFLDDVATCGLVCSFCNMATAPNAQVHDLSKAFVVAFYERHLRGDVAYDTYLTGAMAQARYVMTGEATIDSK